MIFYFSATGNSMFIAKTISSTTGDKVGNIVDIMRDKHDFTINPEEKIGIISPVYFYGLPLIVEEFIEKIAENKDNKFFIVLNYGTFPGQAMARAEKIFSSFDIKLHSKMTVRMPENYTLLFNPPNIEECGMIISDAKHRISQFAEKIKNDVPTDMCETPTVIQRTIGSLARSIYVHGRGTGRFHTNTNCIKCGKCVNMCPCNAIKMIDRTPTWIEKKCLRCCACINRCPHKAIEFGLLTKNKRRYVNPEMDLTDAHSEN